MSRLLFYLRSPHGVMNRECCDDIEIDDARSIRAKAKAMATDAICAGADLDDLTVQVIFEEPVRDNPVVAVLNCYRLVNSPI